MAIDKKKFLDEQSRISSIILPEEIKEVDKIEKYIDTQIEKMYDSRKKCIEIEFNIASFRWNPISKNMTDWPETSRIRMHKELINRYEKSGWKVSIRSVGEGSIHEQDYFVLE